MSLARHQCRQAAFSEASQEIHLKKCLHCPPSSMQNERCEVSFVIFSNLGGWSFPGDLSHVVVLFVMNGRCSLCVPQHFRTRECQDRAQERPHQVYQHCNVILSMPTVYANMATLESKPVNLMSLWKHSLCQAGVLSYHFKCEAAHSFNVKQDNYREWYGIA